MSFQKDEIHQYIEPIYRFCLNRLANRCDAEDLAEEILLHILEGADKYAVDNPDAWVWRIARNRYARFLTDRNRQLEVFMEEGMTEMPSQRDFTEDLADREIHDAVFRGLHTLSMGYRNLMVDYYIGELPVKELCRKYQLPATTVKWRLNVGRRKVRERMDEYPAKRIYQRINWNTQACNGSMDTDRYLHTQLARAICLAIYEKPLNVEEISLATGIPALYIEDELPRLLDGDAVREAGGRYAADFIILRHKDQRVLQTDLAPLASRLADHFENRFQVQNETVSAISFQGSDMGMAHLGYIAVPSCLRRSIRRMKEQIGLTNGPFPQRKDGGYGWFIVTETADQHEEPDPYNCGLNCCSQPEFSLYYHTVNRYFDNEVYACQRWLTENRIPSQCKGCRIPDGLLNEDALVRLLRAHLIEKRKGCYFLRFPRFTPEQYAAFIDCFALDGDTELEKQLTEYIHHVRTRFASFVPSRLDSQINQWVSCYVHGIAGYVLEELIRREVLEKPEEDKPLTNGIFCLDGPYQAI